MFTIGLIVGFVLAAIPGVFALLLAHKRGQLNDRWEKVFKKLQGIVDTKDETMEIQRKTIARLQGAANKLITDRMKSPWARKTE